MNEGTRRPWSLVAMIGLGFAGCSSNRYCCRPCIGDGIPLENVVAFSPGEYDGAVVGESPSVPQGSTGSAPEAVEWKPAQPGQQVPPVVHPSPPPRKSTSSKVDDTGKAPEAAESPKQLPIEPRPMPEVPKVEPKPADKPAAEKKSIPEISIPEKKTEAPKPPALPKTEPVSPPKSDPKPPPRDADMRPASLRVKISTSMVVTSIGDKVAFDVVVENQGGMPVSRVDVQVLLNDNLKPIEIEPADAGRVEKNTATLTTIRELGSEPKRFRIRAEVVKQDGGVGLATVEALSPILTSGPLRDQATIRILPKE